MKRKKDKESLIKLDLGCGKHKQAGCIGVDVRKVAGVDFQYDLRNTPYPWADDSVDEITANYLISYFTQHERICFFNECCRILKRGSKLMIRVPHWSGMRSIQDPFFQWPPICETTFLSYNKEWREKNECFYYDDAVTADFDFGYGYQLDGALDGRNDQYKQEAILYKHNCVLDLLVTMTKR